MTAEEKSLEERKLWERQKTRNESWERKLGRRGNQGKIGGRMWREEVGRGNKGERKKERR